MASIVIGGGSYGLGSTYADQVNKQRQLQLQAQAQAFEQDMAIKQLAAQQANAVSARAGQLAKASADRDASLAGVAQGYFKDKENARQFDVSQDLRERSFSSGLKQQEYQNRREEDSSEEAAEIKGQELGLRGRALDISEKEAEDKLAQRKVEQEALREHRQRELETKSEKATAATLEKKISGMKYTAGKRMELAKFETGNLQRSLDRINKEIADTEGKGPTGDLIRMRAQTEADIEKRGQYMFALQQDYSDREAEARGLIQPASQETPNGGARGEIPEVMEGPYSPGEAGTVPMAASNQVPQPWVQPVAQQGVQQRGGMLPGEERALRDSEARAATIRQEIVDAHEGKVLQRVQRKQALDEAAVTSYLKTHSHLTTAPLSVLEYDMEKAKQENKLDPEQAEELKNRNLSYVLLKSMTTNIDAKLAGGDISGAAKYAEENLSDLRAIARQLSGRPPDPAYLEFKPGTNLEVKAAEFAKRFPGVDLDEIITRAEEHLRDAPVGGVKSGGGRAIPTMASTGSLSPMSREEGRRATETETLGSGKYKFESGLPQRDYAHDLGMNYRSVRELKEKIAGTRKSGEKISDLRQQIAILEHDRPNLVMRAGSQRAEAVKARGNGKKPRSAAEMVAAAGGNLDKLVQGGAGAVKKFLTSLPPATEQVLTPVLEPILRAIYGTRHDSGRKMVVDRGSSNPLPWEVP